MGDRILFLGTGGDSIVIGKQFRASGGIILEAEGNQIHIDPGPGALVLAKYYGVNLRENTALFLSHNHLNHAGDANAVISAMTHNGLDKKGVLVASESCLNATPDNEPFVHSFYKSCVERVISVNPGSKIGINQLDIKIIKTKHLDTSGVGFKFYTPKFTLGYVSDTEYFNDLCEEYGNSDILILNVTHPGSVKCPGSMNTESATAFLQKTKPRLAIITHFGVKMLESDPLYEARELQKETGVQVIAAKDGMIISPETYSSEQRQKTLKSY
ncbi:MAG: MBL fold metallo-hydrolase [archaeon]